MKTMALLAMAVLLVPATAQAQSFAELRNEGICNIGWVAGNAHGHPIWPDVRPYVGEGGEYYDAFLRLLAPGETPEVQAHLNVRLYNECRSQGGQHVFNEAEGMSRIVRSNDIVNELLGRLR